MNYEEEVMGLIGAAGESKDMAFQALDSLKDGDIAKAKELIAKSHESDVVAHNVQTKLISAEMDPEQEDVPMTLLMAHAQDHFMTTQLARELIEHFIDVYEAQGVGSKEISTKAESEAETDNSGDDDPGEETDKNLPQKISRAKSIANSTADDKMRILLCCEGGLSTNLLVAEMKKAVKNSSKLKDENFEFIAIPIDDLELKINDWDVVLIGPQVGHRLDFVENVCKTHNKPYQIIDKEVYGAVDGQTVVKMGIVLYRKNKM